MSWRCSYVDLFSSAPVVPRPTLTRASLTSSVRQWNTYVSWASHSDAGEKSSK